MIEEIRSSKFFLLVEVLSLILSLMVDYGKFFPLWRFYQSIPSRFNKVACSFTACFVDREVFKSTRLSHTESCDKDSSKFLLPLPRNVNFGEHGYIYKDLSVTHGIKYFSRVAFGWTRSQKSKKPLKNLEIQIPRKSHKKCQKISKS